MTNKTGQNWKRSSTVAANLAGLLSEKESTLIVDLDFERARLPLRLTREMRPSLEDMIEDEAHPVQHFAMPDGVLDVVGIMRNTQAPQWDEEYAQQFLAAITCRWRYIVLNCGTIHNPLIDKLQEHIDVTVLVTNTPPNIPYDENFHLVLNRSSEPALVIKESMVNNMTVLGDYHPAMSMANLRSQLLIAPHIEKMIGVSEMEDSTKQLRRELGELVKDLLRNEIIINPDSEQKVHPAESAESNSLLAGSPEPAGPAESAESNSLLAGSPGPAGPAESAESNSLLAGSPGPAGSPAPHSTEQSPCNSVEKKPDKPILPTSLVRPQSPVEHSHVKWAVGAGVALWLLKKGFSR